MTATWFNPFDGIFSEPNEKVIDQWPSFKKTSEGFQILIVEISPASQSD